MPGGDGERYRGFVCMRARVRPGAALNLYDPAIIERMAAADAS